jgi:hypothetical protein
VKDKMRNARDGVVKQTHSGVEQGMGEEPGNILHGMQDICELLSIPEEGQTRFLKGFGNLD